MFHTFGDSHACSYHSAWPKTNNIITHHLGPILCYSFGIEKLNRCNISNFNIMDGDSVIFCFGEIDCRNHINKYISDDNDYNKIISNIVNNYFDAIDINISTCKKNLKYIFVYNVIPPIRYRKEAPDHPFPYLGTDDERKNYVLCFNKHIERKCLEKKYIFFNIYDDIKDKEGFLKKELSDNNCHLKNDEAIKNFLNNYI